MIHSSTYNIEIRNKEETHEPKLVTQKAKTVMHKIKIIGLVMPIIQSSSQTDNSKDSLLPFLERKMLPPEHLKIIHIFICKPNVTIQKNNYKIRFKNPCPSLRQSKAMQEEV